MHAWHDIELGSDFPHTVPTVIEVPKGSKNKYELDKRTGLIKLDRVLYSSMHYPTNYGFVPRTLCEDGDPLDILLLGQDSVVPLALAYGRPIGGIDMRDEGREDRKLLLIHVGDPEYAHYQDIEDLPPHLMLEIRRFFEDYKTLEGKAVTVESPFGKDEAVVVLESAAEAYRREFGKHQYVSANSS